MPWTRPRAPYWPRRGQYHAGRCTGAHSGWLRLVMDSMHEGFGLLAPDFTILELNSEAMRIDGRAREAVIGQSHWVAYPDTEHHEVGRLYKKAMAERVSISLEHRYEWADGRKSWFETRAFPVENGCLAIFFRDVTERHLADEALGRSEQRFRAAVAAIDGVLWTNSPDGQMVGEQPGWASLSGQTYDQYQGYGWSVAIHPDDAQPTIDAWAAAVNSKTTFRIRTSRSTLRWKMAALCGPCGPERQHDRGDRRVGRHPPRYHRNASRGTQAAPACRDRRGGLLRS